MINERNILWQSSEIKMMDKIIINVDKRTKLGNKSLMNTCISQNDRFFSYNLMLHYIIFKRILGNYSSFVKMLLKETELYKCKQYSIVKIDFTEEKWSKRQWNSIFEIQVYHSTFWSPFRRFFFIWKVRIFVAIEGTLKSLCQYNKERYFGIDI